MILHGLRAGSPALRTPVAARLLPDAADLIFGTTTRITCLNHPSCLSRKATDLRFLRTLRDRRSR
jgi:hypothetical protein